MSLMLAILAQVGPMVTPGAAPPLPHETEIPAPRRHAQSQAQPEGQPQPSAVAAPPPPSRLQECLELAENEPEQAIDAAQDWLDKEKGPGRVAPGQCLGVAHAQLGNWTEAEAALLAARDSALTEEHEVRARIGAMAGNYALAGGKPEAALVTLDAAHADAMAVPDAALAGAIAIDRASALVALKRDDEAATALTEARTSRPNDAQAWLLSATLSRRMGKLAEAQQQIQRAADILPIDPGIGLEAGVIAMLSGREESARRSWQSVIDAKPDSGAAATARGYIAQLGPSTPNTTLQSVVPKP